MHFSSRRPLVPISKCEQLRRLAVLSPTVMNPDGVIFTFYDTFSPCYLIACRFISANLKTAPAALKEPVRVNQTQFVSTSGFIAGVGAKAIRCSWRSRKKMCKWETQNTRHRSYWRQKWPFLPCDSFIRCFWLLLGQKVWSFNIEQVFFLLA